MHRLFQPSQSKSQDARLLICGHEVCKAPAGGRRRVLSARQQQLTQLLYSFLSSQQISVSFWRFEVRQDARQ